MVSKDFGLIENDYSFFMAHATEAASDVDEYARQLSGFTSGQKTIHMLDFGCGTGEFTHQLLSNLGWSEEQLRLTLVEPVAHQREEAARKLAGFTRAVIETPVSLQSLTKAQYDLAVANHVLYYVEDLATTLHQMLRLVKSDGLLLLAIAGWENALIQLWKIGFELLGRSVPYFVSENVEAFLAAEGVSFRKSKAAYELRFPDTNENRMKILRFLFGEYLPTIPIDRLLTEFDKYVRTGEIEIKTDSDHYTIESTT